MATNTQSPWVSPDLGNWGPHPQYISTGVSVDEWNGLVDRFTALKAEAQELRQKLTETVDEKSSFEVGFTALKKTIGDIEQERGIKIRDDEFREKYAENAALAREELGYGE